MSLSGALSNALSGLTASSRMAELISSNIANAMNESYGRRDISLGTRSGHGGVTIGSTARMVDKVLLADRRLADAEAGYASAQHNFAARIESAFGSPLEAGSLSALLADLEVRLTEAAASPGNPARLSNVATAAAYVVQEFNTLERGLQSEREIADVEIGRLAAHLNTQLNQLQKINVAISQATVAGQDTASFEDHRQATIDEISEIVPVRKVSRDHGMIALYSTGGAILFDRKPARIEFDRTPVIMPHMEKANGLLGGLTLNGQPVLVNGSDGPLGGGSLAAQFDIRDKHTVEIQANLDAVARNLAERLQSAFVDPTIGAGQPGLFADGVGDVLASNEVGLAGRLRLNSAIDPNTSGGLWRLRDGLGAVSPGEAGNATILNNLRDILADRQLPASGTLASGMASVGALSDSLLSDVASRELNAEAELGFVQTRRSELQSLEAKNGVDTDYEMERLLQIEASYAANAKVMKTLDEMLEILLGI